ncbi:MAG: PDZ domain-containing protein, partial [Cyclobacteriaceae bacterium]
DKEEAEKSVKIDFDRMEERVVILPMEAGNYADLSAASGKLIYHKASNTGSASNAASLYYYDLKERESKMILEDADGFELSADGQKIGIFSNGKIAVVDLQPNQKMDKIVSTGDMKTLVDPKAEWKQIFTDAWRLQRDFFYDKNMHGLDWEAIRKQYEPLIDDAVTRRDVNYVLGEVIGELNASHTYRGGGDTESGPYTNVGYLGVDWEQVNGKYRIKSILKGARWDAEAKSPLNAPGIKVNEGDYILAVNGIKLDGSREPYAAFAGMAGKTVELMVSSSGNMSDTRKVIVKTMGSEARLRHLAWIEANRKRVEEATDGQIGYIYVRSTGYDGQNELIRQFMAQIDKKGLIIDERFNSGGQIPDRFVELLNRKPLAYFAVRDGKDWKWPNTAVDGPKAMLINGWSGSGGDAFPDYFRKTGLGPLIGSRTWGGLIGISGVPQLIDGGTVSVPTFRMYDPDGKWFREGYGVEPDIKVGENPGELARGTDAQLERAIAYVLEELKNYKGDPEHEGYEKR